MLESNYIEAIKKQIQKIVKVNYRTLLIINIQNQKLFMLNDEIKKEYPISTSKFGIGNKENSNKTPLGIHRVFQLIGDGAPIGRIFKSRIDTGINWDGISEQENLILTRIIRLEGLEEGINKGDGIDSLKRYIYIHGTDKENKIGTPITHGCIVMKNKDIVDLFNKLQKGDIVVIR